MGTIVKVAEDVRAGADAVWDALSDFSGIKVGGPITSFETEGEGVGMIRKIGMGGKMVIEKLDVHSAQDRVFTYSIINEDAPLPVSDYSATVSITPIDEHSCHVDWTGTFVPKGDEETAIKVVTGIYKGGIAGAKKRLGV